LRHCHCKCVIHIDRNDGSEQLDVAARPHLPRQRPPGSEDGQWLDVLSTRRRRSP
jgi:hypothetical protein